MTIDYKKEQIYYPMLVSITGGKNDDKNELKNLWSHFDTLPANLREIISSEKIVDFIYGISRHFNLNEYETEEFSRTIRQYFFGEIADGQFAQIVSKLCQTSNEEGLSILHSIKNIRPVAPVAEMKRNLVTGEMQVSTQQSVQNFSSKSSQENSPVRKPVATSFTSSQGKKVFSSQPSPVSNSNFSQMPIKRAMNLFPKLDAQIFTETPIISKKYLKPIKPTIKNWLMIYEDFMGTGKKSSLERGNFLFQSDAAKNLSTDEKQKLAFLLKSADENFPLTVDRSKGEVIFTENQQTQAIQQTQSVQSSQSENFSFEPEEVNISSSQNFSQQEQSVRELADDKNTFSNSNKQVENFSDEEKSEIGENFNSLNQSTQENNFSENQVEQRNSDLEKEVSFSGNSSNFNAQAYEGFSKADFSNSKPSIEDKKSTFNANYSIDELGKKIGGRTFSNKSFDEDLSFNPSSSKNQNDNGLDNSLSFTSNHVLPVEKSLLEKQQVG